MPAATHAFEAVAFAENFKLEELKPLFAGAAGTPHELSLPLAAGRLFVYPFGVLRASRLGTVRRCILVRWKMML